MEEKHLLIVAFSVSDTSIILGGFKQQFWGVLG